MAIVKQYAIAKEIIGAIGKKIWGRSEADKSGATMQVKNGKTIIMKKQDPTKKVTQKQLLARNKFCLADLAYRNLTWQQRNLWLQYVAELNKRTGKNWSAHTWWMHLALTNGLNEFFEKYLHLRFSETITEEYTDKYCYTIIIKREEQDYITDELSEMLAAIRR